MVPSLGVSLGNGLLNENKGGQAILVSTQVKTSHGLLDIQELVPDVKKPLYVLVPDLRGKNESEDMPNKNKTLVPPVRGYLKGG